MYKYYIMFGKYVTGGAVIFHHIDKSEGYSRHLVKESWNLLFEKEVGLFMGCLLVLWKPGGGNVSPGQVRKWNGV